MGLARHRREDQQNLKGDFRMKYKLTIFAYSIFVLNVIGLLIFGLYTKDWFPVGVCALPCCMVWLHAERVRKREKNNYKSKEILG